jgi:hypothetical protein
LPERLEEFARAVRGAVVDNGPFFLQWNASEKPVGRGVLL